MSRRAPTAREALSLILRELGRRARWRKLVRDAGYVKDDWARVSQSEMNRDLRSRIKFEGSEKAFATELRQFLLLEGWRERRIRGPRFWCAKRVDKEA